MKAIIIVFLGSGLGGVARYALSKAVNNSSYPFPLGTFAANILACFLLGLILGLGGKLENHTRLLLTAGFCGGFSTFSAFSGENFLLLQQGQILQAFFYIAATVVVCIAATFLGYLISGWY